MDNNRQQRNPYGRPSNQGQQDPWRDSSDMDNNYNQQQGDTPHPGYGEVYQGNLRQREEDTNRARGRNYGQQGGQHQGGMFQGGSQGANYNPGGYGQVGNTGGGYGGWDSQGSSGQDMGSNYGSRTHMDYGQQGGYGNTGGAMNRQGSYSQNPYRGDNDQYGRNRRHDDNDNSWWDRAKNEVKGWFNDDDRSGNRNYNMHEGTLAGNRRMVGDHQGSDHRSRGEHFGKGPRGYQRSEDRIREDVCERLAYDGNVDASDIEVKVEGHEVVLTGTVRTRAEKRRAEDLVESIMGVQNVENRIRVQDQNMGSWGTAGNRSQHDSSRSYGSTTGDSNRNSLGDNNRSADSGRYSSTSGTTTGGSLENRSYTGNSGDQSGIGNESGTTNEIIRNSGATDTNL